MEKNKSTITVGLEDVLQLVELADRLGKLNYASRTEINFVKSFAERIYETIQEASAKAQNNKVDENDKKE